MRALHAIAGLILASTAASALAQPTPAAPGAESQKVYALVAAFPDRFSFVYETTPSMRNGAVRVDRDRRSTFDAPAGTFNRIALVGLEKSIAEREPETTRLHLSIQSSIPDRIVGAEREDYLMDQVRAELEKMPQRRNWHRILVALPAYRALPLLGLPGRLEGFGVFLQPNCESRPGECGNAITTMGPEVVTPRGEATRASFFIAPYAYISVWTLDPATLAVLDRQTTNDHQKMFDPRSGTVDLGVNVPREILAKQVVEQIEKSVENALAKSDPVGKVKVHDVREVKPDAPPK